MKHTIKAIPLSIQEIEMKLTEFTNQEPRLSELEKYNGVTKIYYKKQYLRHELHLVKVI